MAFQKTVLIIASVVLVICFIIAGYVIHSSNTGEVWPPIIGECPDYWKDEGDKGSACVNSHRLGSCNLPSGDDSNSMNFNVAPFNTSSGSCSKYTWAKSCGVTWDGLTYGAPSPCE